MARNRARTRRVPTAEDWRGYEADLDVQYAHRLMFGKTLDEVQTCFGGMASIGRADELLHMPRRAFQFYVFAFAKFVLSEHSEGDPDSASPFLKLLVCREQRDPGSVQQIYAELAPIVATVAARQAYYWANPSIYGDFKDHEAELRRLCE